MRKVISFCVWGRSPIYNYGLYENAIRLQKVFPGWHMLVYHTKTADLEVMAQLSKMPNVETILIDTPDHHKNTMLRFMAAFDRNNEAVIFRDADARLLQRDYMAVSDWLKNSDKDFHIIRDHPANGRKTRISAGLWGVRNHALAKPEIIKQFNDYFRNPDYKGWTVDERYLFEYIYPLAKDNSRIHADFNRFESHATKFPAGSQGRHRGFCGQTVTYTPNASKFFGNVDTRHNKRRISNNKNANTSGEIFIPSKEGMSQPAKVQPPVSQPLPPPVSESEEPKSLIEKIRTNLEENENLKSIMNLMRLSEITVHRVLPARTPVPAVRSILPDSLVVNYGDKKPRLLATDLGKLGAIVAKKEKEKKKINMEDQSGNGEKKKQIKKN